MIKYTTLLIVAFFMLGCGSKTAIKAPKVSTTKTEIANVNHVSKEAKTQKKVPSLPAGFKEEKKLRPIGVNVPTTCQEWSDGCNSCARAGNGQASCTIYTCENKAPFSCLKWQ